MIPPYITSTQIKILRSNSFKTKYNDKMLLHSINHKIKKTTTNPSITKNAPFYCQILTNTIYFMHTNNFMKNAEILY